MAQMSVMVLLHHITQLLAQGHNRHLMEPRLRWYYDQFEVMLGFLTYYEGNNWRFLAKEIGELAHRAEDHVHILYRIYSIAQWQITGINHEEKLITKDIEGIINRIEGLMSGSSSSGRFEYDSTREKAVQMLKQSLPRTTRGWVADPEANVARDNTKHCGRLVDRLINGGPPKLDLITIVGYDEPSMTHLVKKVYSDASIVGYFNSRAWVLVSERYILWNLLLSILNDVMDITQEGIYDEMDEWELKRQLRKLLGDHRYLIVFQNVGNSNFWDKEMKDAFPVNNKGSRIIFTTDNFPMIMLGVKAFDLECQSCSPYSESRKCNGFYLADLTREEAWEHFSKTVFGENKCPKELEHLGQTIVERCHQLSFVRLIVGGILRGSGKTDLIRWSNLAAQFEALKELSHFYHDEGMLYICYNEMPQHLKPCLLHLGLFWGDVDIIPVKQVMRLWIAEGLVQWVDTNSTNKAGRSMEDVAEEDYLEGLIGLNFIQVMERRLDGGPKSFRLHESVWQVCINRLREENFIEVPSGYCQVEPRRICALNDDWGLKYIIPNIRSFHRFSKTGLAIENQWKSFLEASSLLRILNLGEVEVAKLPKDIMGELFHLRYLSMKPTKNVRVPKSIFNLLNLQTIDLRTTRFWELPKGIWKMQQLRHLFLNGDGQSRLPNPECEDCTLPNLQTLSFISIDLDDDINLSKRTPNLKKLGLYGFRCFPMSEQHVNFNFPPHLRSLKFVEECAFEEQIKFPDTITKITLKGIQLEQNVIDTFGKLPNLQILKLVKTGFDDGELFFGEDSFPQLQLLKFEVSNIVTWRLAEGAMPNLHHLIISKCPQLTEPPFELQKVKTLQELQLSWASLRLVKKLEDYLKENEGFKLVIHAKGSA